MDYLVLKRKYTDKFVWGWLETYSLGESSEFLCWTLELPYKDNAKNISCIPKGAYYVECYESSRFGETFKFSEVKNRTDILFHAGNTIEDTKGCILPGTLFDPVKGILQDSRKALKKIKRWSQDNDFGILII